MNSFLKNYVVCDDSVLRDCNEIKQYLNKKYKESAKEVQDVLNIASKSITGLGGNIVFTHKSFDYGEAGTQKGVISVKELDKDDHFMWITFAHEMTHQAMYGTWDKTDPYNTELINKIAYNIAIDRSFPLFMKLCLSHAITAFFCAGPLKYGHFLSSYYGIDSINWYQFTKIPLFYHKNSHDAEYIARYYQTLADNKKFVDSPHFSYMLKWHNQYLKPMAVKKGLLESDDSIENSDLDPLVNDVDLIKYTEKIRFLEQGGGVQVLEIDFFVPLMTIFSSNYMVYSLATKTGQVNEYIFSIAAATSAVATVGAECLINTNENLQKLSHSIIDILGHNGFLGAFSGAITMLPISANLPSEIHTNMLKASIGGFCAGKMIDFFEYLIE